MSDLTERLRKPMNREEFFKVADGLCREAADEIDRLTEAYEDMKSDYLRRHNDACDRFLEIDRLTRELAEAREALGKAEAYIPTGTVECRGDKCRELWCVSCFGEEEAEREIERATLLAEEIRAMKEKP